MIPEGYHNGSGYLTVNGQSVAIPEGYHNGSGYVTVNSSAVNVPVTVESWSKTKRNGKFISTKYYKGIQSNGSYANKDFRVMFNSVGNIRCEAGTNIEGYVYRANSSGQLWFNTAGETYRVGDDEGVYSEFADVKSMVRIS